MRAACEFEHFPDEKDERGRMRNVCRRCGREIWQPYHPKDWQGVPVWCDCNLAWHRFGQWLGLIFAAHFVYKTPGCACHEREATANAFGSWLNSLLPRLTATLRSWL